MEKRWSRLGGKKPEYPELPLPHTNVFMIWVHRWQALAGHPLGACVISHLHVSTLRLNIPFLPPPLPHPHSLSHPFFHSSSFSPPYTPSCLGLAAQSHHIHLSLKVLKANAWITSVSDKKSCLQITQKSDRKSILIPSIFPSESKPAIPPPTQKKRVEANKSLRTDLGWCVFCSQEQFPAALWKTMCLSPKRHFPPCFYRDAELGLG